MFSPHPTPEDFLAIARPGLTVPVWRELLADTETPVSAFRKLVGDQPFAFLLESVEGGEKLGRYSFIGCEPAAIVAHRRGQAELLYPHGAALPSADLPPLEALRAAIGRRDVHRDPNLPPFCGGAVGFVAYDLIRSLERIPSRNPDVLDLPDLLFMEADSLAVFDHVKRRLILIANATVGDNPHAAYDAALERIDAMHRRLRGTTRYESSHKQRAYADAAGRLLADTENEEHPLSGNEIDDPDAAAARLRIVSDTTREEFERKVRAAKEYILAGDIFQVVLSQRLTTRISADPFDVYRALRAINPSPYLFYLRFGDLRLAGSSPEILVNAMNGQATVRPIAGTRPRGATPEIDKALEAELLADPKERAEHVMLVDLGRNDVGRVSQFGKVRVTEMMVVERYSHVMHIVSNVTGDLRPGVDGLDALAATFPAGTVTGAPKIRAMEVIEELESSRRGPYAGAVAFLGYDGALESCISIRTAVMKGRTVHVQAGAGVVADSDPTAEWQETLNKARALVKAIALAERGLE